jgi:hypothetical protein
VSSPRAAGPQATASAEIKAKQSVAVLIGAHDIRGARTFK